MLGNRNYRARPRATQVRHANRKTKIAHNGNSVGRQGQMYWKLRDSIDNSCPTHQYGGNQLQDYLRSISRAADLTARRAPGPGARLTPLVVHVTLGYGPPRTMSSTVYQVAR